MTASSQPRISPGIAVPAEGANPLSPSARHPLHLAATRTAQIALMRDIHGAAGIDLTERQAAMLVTTITGLVHVALTTPEAIGVGRPDDVRELVRAAADMARVAPLRTGDLGR